MIRAQVLHRTFKLSYRGSKPATCFALDVENRQYIITAKHLVKGIGRENVLEIYHDRKWKQLPVRLVGHAVGEVDISVLALPTPIAPPHLTLPATWGGLAYGQDVYFLGFPYNMHTDIGEKMAHFPLPFARKAIVSAIDFENKLIYLDGHNNEGFSGGPVVFVPLGTTPEQQQVAAVIAGYKIEREPVYDEEDETGYTYEYNTGIVLAYTIDHALDLIAENPIGAPCQA